jgi:hypothetical protein
MRRNKSCRAIPMLHLEVFLLLLIVATSLSIAAIVRDRRSDSPRLHIPRWDSRSALDHIERSRHQP